MQTDVSRTQLCASICRLDQGDRLALCTHETLFALWTSTAAIICAIAHASVEHFAGDLPLMVLQQYDAYGNAVASSDIVPAVQAIATHTTGKQWTYRVSAGVSHLSATGCCCLACHSC